MYKALTPLFGLLTSAGVLLVGHGLQLTLLPLRAEGRGWSAVDIGLTGTAYFAGFVLGCLTVPGILARVGHIRTFAALAACATAILLLLTVLPSLPVWMALRAGTGWCFAGLYMAIESWLNQTAQARHRGSVLAVYTVVVLLGMAAAQMLLSLGDPADDLLFKLAAACICLSLVPVCLAGHIAPGRVSGATLSLRKLYRSSPTGALAALFGGMATGSFWALGPLYARRSGFEIDAVGLFMMSVILGGALAQYPLGRLSDRIDRRRVLLVVTGVGAAACLAISVSEVPSRPGLFAGGFLFGAVSLPIYALCVAHANDNVANDQFVETAGGILMMNGVGSMAGPLLAAPLMSAWGPVALFAATASFLGAACLWTASRLRVVRRRDHFDRFIPLAQTSQSALDIVAEASQEDREASRSHPAAPTPGSGLPMARAQRRLTRERTGHELHDLGQQPQ